MSRHGDRQIGVGDEGREIDAFQFGARRLDPRQLQMAVGASAPMAGNVLHDRRDAAVEQPPRSRAADARYAFRVVAIGAIPDDAMRAKLRGVQHRETVDGDSDFA